MTHLNEVPQFGSLTGVKVLCHGQTVAGPYAACFMAEHGATVVNLEHPKVPDSARVTDAKRNGHAWDNGHRNELGVALNMSAPEGKEVFLKLIEWADIFTEGTKGGTYKKWGLTDEELWKVNPKLVIIHESGFGQTGDPSFVPRGSYDMVGQAFGGTMVLNGPKSPGNPVAGRWAVNDYMATLFMFTFALAAYIKAQKTGKGDSVDISQFETGWKTQGGVPMTYFQEGISAERYGYDAGPYAGVNVYTCKDGEYVFVSLMQEKVVSAAVKMFGLEGDPDFAQPAQLVKTGTSAGDKLEAAIQDYCDKHTAEEAEAGFVAAGVAASRPYDTGMALEDPHVQARGVFDSWYSFNTDREVTGVGTSPQFKNAPARIWRSAPLHGMDNMDVLTDLGYSEEEIADLYEKGIIGADKRVMRPAKK